MTPMTDKQLERALRGAATGGDLDRAVDRVLAEADRDGLIDIGYASMDSPFGELLIAATDRGVVKLALPTQGGVHPSEEETLQQLAERIAPRVLRSPKRIDPVRRELDQYFEGKLRDFDIPVDWQLSHGFTGKVLHEVARIPYGETRSYG